MMGIAATLVVILAAGLLFRPGTHKLVLHGQSNPQRVIVETALVVKSDEPAIDPYQDLAPEQRIVKQSQTAVAAVKHQAMNEVGSEGIDPVIVNHVDTMQNIAVTKTLNIAKPDHQDNGSIKIAAPVTNVVANNVTPKADASANPAKAIAMNPQGTKAQEVVKKKKIHSLGDLLNVVIAKVDKRDNKIIQFGGGSDDDDDDLLNVTSVNLGPIKVKKQN